MSRQFKRAYELKLINTDGRVIISKDLRVNFEITKDLFGYPNLARISVYNFSLERVNEISEEFTNVEFKAGYADSIVTIFKGDIRNIVNRRDGVDTITEFYAGDGERVTRESYFSRTYSGGTPLKQVVNDLASNFNIPKAQLDGLDSVRKSLKGLSFSGPTKEILNKLSDDYGFYWSIQDGQFVTQDRDKADLENEVTVVTRSTGMIGSPSVTEIGADVRILLNPDIQPYRAFKIETPNFEVNVGNLFFRKQIPTLGEGLFRVNKVVHSGDTRGTDWFSSITGRRLS